jgi:hypothetical protein
LAVGLGVAVFACAFLAVAILSFYLEENARGAAAWKQALRQIEAQGFSFRRGDYIPDTPPADQNFGASPLFAIEPDPHPNWPHGMKAATLEKALDPIASRLPYARDGGTARPDSLPYLPRWDQGPAPDLQALRLRLGGICRRVEPDAPPEPGSKATAFVSKLCPALDELRRLAASRSLCVFPLNYDVEPPTDFSFAPISQLLQLARVLTFDERLALYEGDSQLALADMVVGQKVIAGLRQEPLLISGLVAGAFEEDQAAVIEQGLAGHDWNDTQLRQLETLVGSFDVLAGARFWLAGEIVTHGHPVGNYYEQHRWVSDDVFRNFQNRLFDFDYKPPFLAKVAFFLEPRGWLELDRAIGDRYSFCDVAGIFDAKRHRVAADKYDAATEAIGQQRSWTFWSLPPVDPAGQTGICAKNLALFQVHVDEACIGCRIERYRLIHGAYPSALDVLGDETLPHDVMNGERYHYRLRSDGSYLLYSVGWNQEDDHGISTLEPGQPQRDALDWVWPSRPISR